MKYNSDTIEILLESLQEEGSVEIACRKADIKRATFYEWLKDPKKADFSDAVKKTRAVFLANRANMLEQSLYKRACGYDYTEEKIVWKLNDKKQLYIHERIIFSKHEAPDVNALIFALCNLDPTKWGVNRKTEIEVTKKDLDLDESDILKYLTKEEIHFLAEIMLKVEKAKKEQLKKQHYI